MYAAYCLKFIRIRIFKDFKRINAYYYVLESKTNEFPII